MDQEQNIPEAAFQDILTELNRQPILKNYYRKTAGLGKSQAFGVIHRRGESTDYSRMCWKRAYLYKLLLDFGKKWVAIPFTSITVNQGYAAAAHRDRGNVGNSFVIACGDYEGGHLKILEGEKEGSYDIRYKGIVADFGVALHEVSPFTGNRISLVFYTAAKTPSDLPPPSIRKEDEIWVFYRGDQRIGSGKKGEGLPHPLKGRRVKID